jgi:hypothetical protein
MKLSTLKKMDELQKTKKFPELSKPISILNLVKYSKQAYHIMGTLNIMTYPHLKSKASFWVMQKTRPKATRIT